MLLQGFVMAACGTGDTGDSNLPPLLQIWLLRDGVNSALHTCITAICRNYPCCKTSSFIGYLLPPFENPHKA